MKNEKHFKIFSRPVLPQGARSPVMDCEQMESWLEDMLRKGWKFSSFAQTTWHDAPTQSWWIFEKVNPSGKRFRCSLKNSL